MQYVIVDEGASSEVNEARLMMGNQTPSAANVLNSWPMTPGPNATQTGWPWLLRSAAVEST